MTAGIPLEQLAPPEPKRDRYGRYLIDGTPYTRATTVAKTIDDSYSLTRWQLRKACHGLATRPDLVTSAQAHDPDTDRKTFETIVDQALEAAQSKAAATTGTALHRFTEDLDTGRKTIDQIPDEWRPTLTAYLQRLDTDRVAIHPEWVEQVLLYDNYQIAGTCDRIVTLTDGRRLIADVKTSRNLDFSWLTFGIQLAIYANHTHTYNYLTDTRGPRIDVDTTTALIIHLPSQGPQAGTCTIHTVDIHAGYDALITALETREHRKAARKWGGIYTPHTPLDVAAVANLKARLAELAHHPAAANDMRAQWPTELRDPTGTPRKLTGNATPEQIVALTAVLDRVEAHHEIPFIPTVEGPTKATTSESTGN